MMSKKYYLMILFIISCSIHTIAQKDFNYCGKVTVSNPDLCTNDITRSVPSDPLFYQQWGLYNSLYPGKDINMSPIWNSNRWNYITGKNIKIAIIDAGVDTTHIDLSANIDSISYDTETGNSSHIYYYESNYSHGTHCAGIAAAVKDNGIHIAGVAPNAKIVSISNSLHLIEYNSELLANGIIWACDHGVDVISCSWGAAPNPLLNNAIQYALTNGRHGKGCVIVFAAGNEGNSYVSYPANCNDMILTVGAIKNDGKRWPNSNYGEQLDLVAPGVGIISTIPMTQQPLKVVHPWLVLMLPESRH